MPQLDRDEVELVSEAVANCAAEQEDQLTGRKAAKELLEMVWKLLDRGYPVYTVITAMWVVLHTLAEEWRDSRSENDG